MKSICFVNGSLRGEKASSHKLLTDIERRLPDEEYAKTTIRVKARPQAGYPHSALAQLAKADALVLVFPLYSYTLPGALSRLLEELRAHVDAGNERNPETKVYAVVNCGFPRPVVFDECVRVLKNFCRRLSFDWRFAICISAGPVVVATKGLPFVNPNLKRGLAAMEADLQSGERAPRPDYLVRPVLPAPFCLAVKRWFEWRMDMR